MARIIIAEVVADDAIKEKIREARRLRDKGLKLREIADRNARKARYALSRLVEGVGAKPVFSAPFFNEFVIQLPKARRRHERALERGVLAGVALGDWYAELSY